ncbi:bifunctional phosphopantothenoylcysteine decarboxylase/phosphopantothenate--cysteine ligase CoaBC [Candidatus Magnetominusculus dajiuhuensis]|uniref:bifunctional phosphopantothenoylcysteine decarboxylase/phosphopantothenate--cysteine ligase CoaBC n=1 Tax=Candidatus Magnetominusculus dajiuhuensis TaxID=3137712 RepID=UPI003B432403
MEDKARGRADAARHVVLGVTGGIAAYKSPLIVRAIKDLGIEVRVVMTEAARQFVTPLALEVVSENPVLWDNFQSPLSHINMAKGALALIIAPATLNTISKFSSGIADNLLTTLFMAFRGPVIIAPAMNWRMYDNPIFKDRLAYLKDKGVVEIPPEMGQLACGEQGVGRMASAERIVHTLRRVIGANDMKGLRVVVVSGPTREYIDPVRFITNRSSGKMGLALARVACLRGGVVTLISGPTSLPSLSDISDAEVIRVETSGDMRRAVLEKSREADIVVMAAAVCDFKPERFIEDKISRTERFTLDLIKTTDILAEVSSHRNASKTPYIAGFAAETGDRKDRAREKLKRKGINMIVFNDVTAEGAGFDSDTNIMTVITPEQELSIPKMSKEDGADRIFDIILSHIKGPR